MKQLIVATKNSGKVREFEAILSEQHLSVKSLLDYPEIPEVIEDGATFAENARIKAETIANHFGQMVIADDSGLAVDALEGRPGVFSARYAGEEKNDQKNYQKVLTELSGIPHEKRDARFHCAIAVAFPGRKTKVVEAVCEGMITTEPKGEHGFGYDPIMYIPEKGKTMAELTAEEKNEISHRAKAIRLLQQHWKEIAAEREE